MSAQAHEISEILEERKKERKKEGRKERRERLFQERTKLNVREPRKCASV